MERGAQRALPGVLCAAHYQQRRLSYHVYANDSNTITSPFSLHCTCGHLSRGVKEQREHSNFAQQRARDCHQNWGQDSFDSKKTGPNSCDFLKNCFHCTAVSYCATVPLSSSFNEPIGPFTFSQVFHHKSRIKNGGGFRRMMSKKCRGLRSRRVASWPTRHTPQMQFRPHEAA